jgi:HEAT repeat protein
MLSVQEQQWAEDATRIAQTGADGVPALLDMLTTPSWSVRRVVVDALAEIGDAAVQPACDLLRSRRDSEARISALCDVLTASTGAVEAAVLELTLHPDPAIVADAAQILGRRRSAAAIPRLTELTLHGDDNVAVAAIEALGRVGGRAAIDVLMTSIKSGNFFRTFPAIDVLGRSGDPRVVAPLAALLEEPMYAHEAARALGHTGDKTAIAPLVALLTRPSDAMVRVAATALAELYDLYRERYGITDAIDAALRELRAPSLARRLAQSLGDAAPAEQVAICYLLGALGSDAAVPSLTNLLSAPAPVGGAAADALKRIGQEAESQMRQALAQGDSARRRVLLPLVAGRGSFGPEVLSCLSDPDQAVRALACDALARIGNPSAVPSLFPLLGDPSPRIVQAAIAAIQSLGSPETERLALAAARSSSREVRRAAFRIITYFGYTSALDLLIEAIHGSDERLRDGAVHGLPFIEDPRAMEALLATARHENARTRAAAMRALGQCRGEPRVTATLQEGLTDPDAWVRYYACQSLGRLAFEPAAEAIAALFNDDAGQVRVAAVEALSHMQSAAAFEALRDAAASGDADMQRAALVGLGISKRPAAVPVLLSAVDARPAATRLVAVSALAGFDEPRVLEALGRAAADKDESVRTAAIGFLAGRSTLEATRVLIDLVRASEPHERVLAALAAPSEARITGILRALEASDDELSPRLTTALARMRRPDAMAALRTALSSPNVRARKAAATTLGAVGSRDAVEALRRAATGDPDPDVRRICALALAS